MYDIVHCCAVLYAGDWKGVILVCGSEFSTQLAPGTKAYTISSVPSDADGVKWCSH